MLGLVNRTILHKDKGIMVALYKSLVRPIMEYCSPAWSPHYVKDKQLIERIQHRFTRMIPGMKDVPYEERLRRLHLWSLEERRNRADVIEVFKMFKGYSDISPLQFFEMAPAVNTRGHSMKLQKKYSNLDLRKYFFSERVVRYWNGLSQECVSAESIDRVVALWGVVVFFSVVIFSY